MGFIREIIVKGNSFFEPYIKRIIDAVTKFLTSGEYLVIGVIAIFVSLLVLIGLIRWLKKAPKLFMFVVIVCGIVIGLWLISK